MSGTSVVTAVVYTGTAQSLNGLAHDLLARGTLCQSCHSCVGFFPLHSCRLAATAFLNSKLVVSLLLNHFCQAYLHMHNRTAG